MASRIARTPVVQLQRHLSAQAAPALRNPSKSSGVEVVLTLKMHDFV